MMMKKISCVAVMMVAFGTTCAGAAYDAGKFRGEVLEGLDIISARTVGYVAPVAAPGELGNEVYEYAGEVAPDDIQMYIGISLLKIMNYFWKKHSASRNGYSNAKRALFLLGDIRE